MSQIETIGVLLPKQDSVLKTLSEDMIQDDLKDVLEWSWSRSIYVFCEDEPWETEAAVVEALAQIKKDLPNNRLCLLDLRTCRIQRTEIQTALLRALKTLNSINPAPRLYEKRLREKVWAKLLETNPSCIIVLGAERLTPKWMYYVYDLTEAFYTYHRRDGEQKTNQTLLICCSRKRLDSFLKNNSQDIFFRPARSEVELDSELATADSNSEEA